MRIAYVTHHDPLDTQKWSGTAYHIGKAIKDCGVEIEYVGPLKERLTVLAWVGARYLLKPQRIKDYLHLRRERLILEDYARQTRKILAGRKFDMVFGPSTFPFSYLDIDKPIAFWTDATFGGLVGFHPDYRKLCRQTIENGNEAELSAIRRSRLCIYSSDWAAESAVKIYGADPSKVKVVPFGVNMDMDVTERDVIETIEARPRDRIRLLFMAKYWKDKGGDIALETVRLLNDRGVKAELTVLGCAPEHAGPMPDYVKPKGFISKTGPKGTEELQRLIREHHFLILPTRGDCTPIVICEAAGLGVPSISTRIGGIPTLVEDGLSGKLFEPGDGAQRYADFIQDAFSRYSFYKDMAMAAFSRYLNRLNWKVSGGIVKRYLEELIS